MGNIHLFSLNNYNIVLDSASGAVHVLNEVCYNLLKRITPPLLNNYDDFLSDEEREAYQELLELYNGGMLFSDDAEIKPTISHTIKSMCLHIAHDCNMRCKYCFAETGDFHRGRTLMSYEIGKAAIDFLLKKSGMIKNLEIDFFGGEPLMNFSVIKQLVEYGRNEEKKYNKNIRFTLTTNGTLLNDDNIKFINEHISNVVLSLDGRKTINDHMRVYENGGGTYDDILPNYKKLVESRDCDKDYYIRGTYTRNNLDFCNDVIHIAESGFNQISVEPVVLNSGDEYSIREEDLPQIFNEYENLALKIIERRKNGEAFNFFHFMIDLDAGPCIYKRIKGCGSGSEYISVTPEGDIYPCHQFVGHSEYLMGNIHKNELNKDMQTIFANNNITSVDDCKKCWVKYFCGGGCAANNYTINKDIAKPYKISCELEKKRVECALMIKAALDA